MNDEEISARQAELGQGRIPCLDGLRACAVLLVIWHHICLNYATQLPLVFRATRFVGDIGVDFFFVISGFLITVLLQRELQRKGHISLKAFYLRRLLRITPAYYACFVSISLILAVVDKPLSLADWLRWTTYTAALGPIKTWDTAHAWSLSVEEHFYLVWPWLVTWFSRRRLIIFAAAYILFAFALRISLRLTSFPLEVGFFSPTRADAIACGCLLALSAPFTRSRRLWWGKQTALVVCVSAVTTLAVLLVVRRLIYSDYGFGFWLSMLDRTVVEGAVVTIVWVAISHSSSGWFRWLNTRPLTTVGVLSYSIYLWQQPFLGPTRHFGILSRLPLNLLAIALLATLSYLLIEKPFLKLKQRFETLSDAHTHVAGVSVAA